MNRFRLLAIGTMLMFVLTAVAQQATTSAGGPAKNVSGGEPAGVPTVETQLKILTAKLDLSGDQQRQIKPILQELRDATVKLVQNESLSREERLAKVRPERYKVRDQIRALLNDGQKKKLDQYLQGPHREMHGDLTGAAVAPQR
jgi:Spy/CpxP family protein refolding chaperone